MRRLFHSFLNISTLEKRGILALLAIVILLLLSLFTMPYWNKQPIDFTKDSTLIVAWEAYKQSRSSTIEANSKNLISKTELFYFDPNTLDSSGFLSLGLTPKQVKLLLNWRRKGKVFKNKEDFSKLYTLTVEQYELLAPYIKITNQNTATTFDKHFPTKPEPDHVAINTADSATLVQLKGIGPFFAHKLLSRRDKLGGYIKHEQLLEAYKFPDSLYTLLKNKLVINPHHLKKIKINSATEEQLKSHPYIGEKLAHHIILYRENLKQFEKIEQLRQVPLMNEEIYRKIAPYLSIE